MLSCVYTFETQKKGESRVEVRQDRVDFSEVEKSLDTKLLAVSSREERKKLKLLEELLLQARKWDGETQRYIQQYTKDYLAVEQEVAPKREMNFSHSPTEEKEMVLVEESLGTPRYEEHPYLDQARQLVAQDKIQEAIALLEKCREEDCWARVYVLWADLKEKDIVQRRADLLAKEAQGVEIEQLIPQWEALRIFSKRTRFYKEIEDEYQRIIAKTQQGDDL